MKKLILIPLIIISTSVFGEEIQYICEFKTQVKIRDYTTSKPKPEVSNIDSRYTFITNGNTGSYINLKDGLKIPLHVVKTGSTITFVEKNTSDNYFTVSIFPHKKIGNGRVGSIYTFISYGQKTDFYDPEQSYGSCLVVN